MWTTVRLDDDLFREAKAVAAASGRTFAELVEDALREVLAGLHAGAVRKHITLPTFKGQGLRPGVDLDDSAALLDLLDRSEVSSDGAGSAACRR